VEKKIANPNDAKPRKKKAAVTPAQEAARRENLVKFRSSVSGKTAMTHGLNTLIRRGELPPVPGAAEIREAVSSLIDDAIVDLGGKEHITSMQKQILESSRLALTVVALASRYLAAEGIVNHRSKPHGLLAMLGTYLNVIRLNAAQLGLERRAKSVQTLDARLAAIAEREHQESKDSDETEIKN
jgi:hypothetical protein